MLKHFKTCTFIGHKKIEATDELFEKTFTLFEKLITKDNVSRFLIGSGSHFNDFCSDILLKLKQKYPFIRRVYVRLEYYNEDDNSFVCNRYDESYFPKCAIGAGQKSYVVRNYHMIDESDICVFYYDENYRPISFSPPKRGVNNCRRSGTTLAYNYAVKKKKNIYNLKE
ncbi:MAG: hypothetical protein E7379_02935 [Clostridiales bacterium]|nr:hypothetical protein [Clostridiales bacterium]